MDIYDLLFYQILKFDPMNSTVLTGEFGNDLLYGLLIPGIILFLILSEFASFVAGSHKGIKHLVTIAALGVIIQSGWYAMIAGVSSIYIPLVLVYFILVFFKRKLITRKQEGAGAGAFGKLMDYSGASSKIKGEIAAHKGSRSKIEVEKAIRDIIGLQTIYKNQKQSTMFTGVNTPGMEESCKKAAEILEKFNRKQQQKIMDESITRAPNFDNDFKVSVSADIIADD